MVEVLQRQQIEVGDLGLPGRPDGRPIQIRPCLECAIAGWTSEDRDRSAAPVASPTLELISLMQSALRDMVHRHARRPPRVHQIVRSGLLRARSDACRQICGHVGEVLVKEDLHVVGRPEVGHRRELSSIGRVERPPSMSASPTKAPRWANCRTVADNAAWMVLCAEPTAPRPPLNSLAYLPG